MNPLSKIENHNFTLYPYVVKKRELVDNLEKKLLIDMEREFDGLELIQQKTLIDLLDDNKIIRSSLEPKIHEEIENRLYFDYLKDLEPKESLKKEENINTSELSPEYIGLSTIVGDNRPSKGLNYPIQEYPLSSTLNPLEQLLDTEIKRK